MTYTQFKLLDKFISNEHKNLYYKNIITIIGNNDLNLILNHLKKK